jgi:TolA-binding protein
MRHSPTIALAALIYAFSAPVGAQNRVEQQVFLELRTLQAHVQRLQLALNAVTEQVKRAEGRMEAQSGETLRGFADQKVQVEAIAAGLRTLSERESDSSLRVLQLTQEMKAIRDGLTLQQTMLNDILALLQQPAAAAGVVDPAAPPGTAPPPPRPAGSIPPSPEAYYKTAFGYFFAGQCESAIAALGEALTRFPEAPQAAQAQLTIGECTEQVGGRNQEALDAYAKVITGYKDPDVVADAHLKQGLLYEKLGRKEEARKVLEQLRKRYPDSSSAIHAVAVLKRMGFIK